MEGPKEDIAPLLDETPDVLDPINLGEPNGGLLPVPTDGAINSILEGSSDVVLKTPVETAEHIVVYRRRFYILLLFALNGFTQGCVWNTWGPLADSAQCAFGWETSTIALMSNWGPIAYIVSTVFFSWLLDVKGDDTMNFLYIFFLYVYFPPNYPPNFFPKNFPSNFPPNFPPNCRPIPRGGQFS